MAPPLTLGDESGLVAAPSLTSGGGGDVAASLFSDVVTFPWCRDDGDPPFEVFQLVTSAGSPQI
ncbi:hypothetical protein Syun_017238 [Stephania yunnanensis]|uniref:Uncharacterized protein n=1 Tax=Stephania yunnanensis TaxID=152371 RepID=A0AAP0P5N0_9MAGN